MQEALANVAKHAGRGVRVTVRLAWEPGGVEVSVVDSGADGTGVALPSGGFGLTGMSERAALGAAACARVAPTTVSRSACGCWWWRDCHGAGVMSTAAEQAPAYVDAEPVRVLVADDQKVVRDGLSLLLGMLPGVEVIGTAVDGTDAVRQAEAALPDVVLMDLIMPNCDGVEATRLIARQQPDVQVVVLTAFSDDDSVFAALRAGARGYLTKNAGAARSCRRYRRCAREMLSWIRRCSAGWWRPSSAASPWAPASLLARPCRTG